MTNNRVKYASTIRKNIGLSINKIRLEKRITLKKLSERTNVSINLLDKFELGKNKINIELIAIIANALNVSAKDFLLK
ncbi:MAG: hypothetical protein COA94_06255 [Rickettsiales bacterium]|nr:MAG: hypothetical protein COA94_06255 [Rickettsiales bacterium]